MDNPAAQAGEVRENPQKHRFELPIEGDAMALAYYTIEDGRVVLTHTEVPAEFSGQGIASRQDKQGCEQETCPKRARKRPEMAEKSHNVP